MRINVAVPEAEVTKPVLDSALESVTRLNEQLIKSGSVPTFRRALARDNIRWKPEPPGDEHFDHAGIVQRRKWGDCDDLAPWHAGSLRASGEDPEAVAVVRRSGPTRWHAYVERSDGRTEDPSREAGMGKHGEGVVGAVLPVMFNATELQGVGGDDLGEYIVRPSVALRPAPRQSWQARVDLPWHEREQSVYLPTDYAMSTIHSQANPAQALVGALEGACKLGVLGGYAHPEHIARIGAICDTIEGVTYEDVAACYGEEHAQAAQQYVGSLWKGIKKVAKGAGKVALKAAPLVSRIVKFIPGVGPLTSEMLDFAVKANKSLSPVVVKAFGKHFGKGGFPVV
jgi:hypothetical protein